MTAPKYPTAIPMAFVNGSVFTGSMLGLWTTPPLWYVGLSVVIGLVWMLVFAWWLDNYIIRFNAYKWHVTDPTVRVIVAPVNFGRARTHTIIDTTTKEE